MPVVTARPIRTCGIATGEPVIAVVKVGTSSLTDDAGNLDRSAMAVLADEIADARSRGDDIVLVSSGAIAAGLPPLGLPERPTDVGVLQATAAPGGSQPRPHPEPGHAPHHADRG